jgi:phage host-nuclease inhibitor protein Gam
MKAKTKVRNKAAALDLPQTDDEADTLLAEYGRHFNLVAGIETRMNDTLASIKERFENDAAPHQARMKEIFDALNAFAGTHRKRLTDNGKTKTVKLPAGELGWRLAPASVRLKRGFSWDAVVAWLQANHMKSFLRLKYEPNKDAMLADPERAGAIEGITIGSAGEAFFIEPFGAELSEPKP